MKSKEAVGSQRLGEEQDFKRSISGLGQEAEVGLVALK